MERASALSYILFHQKEILVIKHILTTLMAAFMMLFIGIGSAAAQGQQEIPLASTNRFATTNSNDLYAKKDDKGVTIFGVVSTLSSNTLTFSIQGKRPDGTYYTVLTSAASAATGTHTIKLYPGMTAAANASVSEPLPPVFRVAVTHTNSGTATYSVQMNRHR